MGPSSSGIPCSAEMCWPDLCSTVSEMLSGLLVHSPTTTLESLVSVSVSVSMVTVVWMSTLRSRLTISPNRGLQGIRFTVNRGEVSSCCLHESLFLDGHCMGNLWIKSIVCTFIMKSIFLHWVLLFWPHGFGSYEIFIQYHTNKENKNNG